MIAMSNSASATEIRVASLINKLASISGVKVGMTSDGVITVDGFGSNRTTGMASLKKYFSSNKFNNSSSSASGGGGGGGGGGGDREDPTIDEKRMISHMEFMLGLIEDALDRNDAIMSRYETEGYLTGVINQLEQEADYLKEKGSLYEEYLAQIEEEMNLRKEKLAGLTEGTQEYDDVLAELEVLQDAYQDYSLALLENTNALVENEEAIKEQREAIREMEIDIRNELYEAIEDREQREEDSLNALVEMQQTVLDAIIARHERERDEILRTTELKIDSLQEEMDALDEAFRKRKELAEEEDKAAQLLELEAKYARIIADPTRGKEALSIQNQILELREEIAWDKAEDEVEAQKESIDQQITSLEDYQEYIENYYEDLLENPRNFLEEVDTILSMSHEDIINWLKENTEEYKNSFDSSREQMVTGWQETLDTMDGIIRTHWDEVEAIIAQGNDAILAFLQENSQDYLEAGKLQAEAYTDEWLEKLEDLRRAYLDIYEEVNKHPFLETDATSTGDSSSGGGGGGGGSGSSDSDKTGKTLWRFWFADGWKEGYANPMEAKVAAMTMKIPNAIPSSEHAAIRQTAIDSVQSYVSTSSTSQSNPTSSTASSTSSSPKKKLSPNSSNSTTSTSTTSTGALGTLNSLLTGKKFATGGLADFTGPAWLDGSPSAPERVLSPQQTKLFDAMVQSLQLISTVRTPAFPSLSSPAAQASGGNTFGDIIVQVDHLESDADYKDMAKKVGEAILEQMNRGTAVGGIRYSF